MNHTDKKDVSGNTVHAMFNTGVAKQIGSYSDAVEVAANKRWLFTSGTPGLSKSGAVPKEFKEQAELAWENIIAALEAADMTVNDIVKVTQYFTRPEQYKEYAPIRKRFIGDARPASMSSIVVGEFIWPEFLLEIEVVAAK